MKTPRLPIAIQQAVMRRRGKISPRRTSRSSIDIIRSRNWVYATRHLGGHRAAGRLRNPPQRCCCWKTSTPYSGKVIARMNWRICCHLLDARLRMAGMEVDTMEACCGRSGPGVLIELRCNPYGATPFPTALPMPATSTHRRETANPGSTRRSGLSLRSLRGEPLRSPGSFPKRQELSWAD